ncbi:hypothetical protein [Halocynthiibacter styelae]|uniref:Uncharacterized protein n=1 Tax=Halocynthiibacter styelae TaxID=2761955 RepID=A0A8J7IY73_9RHOB|nr:hypothetical protein [Paenihalocynthiibacter styelae]MBI1494374.1 hypothetical protein [Paenihalocynthiibacter styelae]
MPELALQPTHIRETVAAIFVEKDDRQALFAKIGARVEHYKDLSLATGNDWTVLFADDSDSTVNLPWLQTDPVYLYQLVPKCLCEVGYKPNIPTPLLRTFAAKIQTTYSFQGSFALLSGHPNARLIDLSNARSVATINMAALQ